VRYFIIIISLLFGTTLIAQDDRGSNQLQVEKLSPLFIVNEEEIVSLLGEVETYLSQSSNKELFDKLFLNEESSIQYVKYISKEPETEKEVTKNLAIATYYFNTSTEANRSLSRYKGVLSKIELYKYLHRYGETDQMKVVTLLLNIHLEGENIEALRLNIVETPLGYRILNIDN